MEIKTPTDFLSHIKNKHLLLDTSIFIDAFSHRNEFALFFKGLVDNDITLVTIEPVLFEFLKGAPL